MSRRALLIGASILALTALHYTAGHDTGASPHHLYRRLYYLPILAAAWTWGARGGLGAAGTVIAVYVPHAFGLFGLHMDPASLIDKVAEIVLYAAIGGIVGSFVDRERANSAELRRSQEVLIASEHQAAMGFLTAGLAHEIRNPLGSIRGAAELLRDQHEEGPARRITQILVSETERLDGVLTRFLRFAGSEPSSRAPGDLSALTQEVLDLVMSEATQRGVRLTHVRCAVTPSSLLDGSQLRQVLLNLVINAMQVQPGGGEIRLFSGVDDPGSARPLFVRVEDAGPGIPEPDRGAVFHPYHSSRPGGTGLGLAISRRVVTEHGGTLSVGDSPLGGASFTLRLPILDPRTERKNGD